MFIYVVFTKVWNIKLSYRFLISNANNHALILLGIQTVWFIATLEEYRGLFLLGFPKAINPGKKLFYVLLGYDHLYVRAHY